MVRRNAKKREYKLIGFKAYTDEDADLVAWWEGIRPGQRSEALRDLIRLALGYYQFDPKPENDLALIHEEIAWMRDALSELPGYVERVIEHVAANAVVVQPGNGNVSHGVDAMSDDAARRREERMKRRQW